MAFPIREESEIRRGYHLCKAPVVGEQFCVLGRSLLLRLEHRVLAGEMVGAFLLGGEGSGGVEGGTLRGLAG